VDLKVREKDVEIVHNIDRCEIYVHALACLSTPHILKIIGYLKKKKVIILINPGSSHNLIDKILAYNLDSFVYPLTNFHVLVANGGGYGLHRKMPQHLT
jgi:hypothetical protein